MVEFFSKAFFFTISLTPFNTPYNKTNGIHNIFNILSAFVCFILIIFFQEKILLFILFFLCICCYTSFMRIQFIGRTPASQAGEAGSIPVIRCLKPLILRGFYDVCISKPINEPIKYTFGWFYFTIKLGILLIIQLFLSKPCLCSADYKYIPLKAAVL